MLTAKHRAIDRHRRDATFRRKLSVLGGELVIEDAEQPLPTSIDPDFAIEDDLLRMVFTACHPVLLPAARVALTLRLVGGLTTGEIARAYLVPESTVAQRIVRAKRRLTTERIPYEVPHGAELASRLDSVLDVIYLIFNEGYTATSGEDWVRVELVEEGLRLGRILTGLLPDEPEVHGLAHCSNCRHRAFGRAADRQNACPPRRPEPLALGPPAHPPRVRRAGTRPRTQPPATPTAGTLRAASGHRRCACDGSDGR